MAGPHHPVVARLASADRSPLLLDGAIGSELERLGASSCGVLWSANAIESHPKLLWTLHAAYAAAGAEILVANTFRTNLRAVAADRSARRADAAFGQASGASGFSAAAERSAELTHRAVTLVRRAAASLNSGACVAGSVAPVEDCYEPGRVPPDDELRCEHQHHAGALRAAGADLAWIETMNTVREARIAAEAAAAVGLPLAVSFVLREDGALLSGESLRSAVAAVEPLAPLSIGLNCVPPSGITQGLPRLRDLTQRRVAAYAHVNNGQPTPGWSFAQTATPEQYAEHAAQWLAAGASVVGGCCGTSPLHTELLRGVLRRASL